MPVEGLPFTLDAMLNSALQQMALSSYKVEGRGNSTVVVLRFTTTAVKSPLEQHQRQCTTYRRKCPSQVSRDQRRAEAHRNQQVQASVEVASPSGLFLPTPPSLLYRDANSDDVFHHGQSPTLSSLGLSHTTEGEAQHCDTHINMTLSATETQTEPLTMPEENVSCAAPYDDEGSSEDECEAETGTGNDAEETGAESENVCSEDDVDDMGEHCQEQDVNYSDIIAMLKELDRKADSVRSDMQSISSSMKAVTNGSLEAPT